MQSPAGPALAALAASRLASQVVTGMSDNEDMRLRIAHEAATRRTDRDTRRVARSDRLMTTLHRDAVKPHLRPGLVPGLLAVVIFALTVSLTVQWRVRSSSTASDAAARINTRSPGDVPGVSGSAV